MKFRLGLESTVGKVSPFLTGLDNPAFQKSPVVLQVEIPESQLGSFIRLATRGGQEPHIMAVLDDEDAPPSKKTKAEPPVTVKRKSTRDAITDSLTKKILAKAARRPISIAEVGNMYAATGRSRSGVYVFTRRLVARGLLKQDGVMLSLSNPTTATAKTRNSRGTYSEKLVKHLSHLIAGTPITTHEIRLLARDWGFASDGGALHKGIVTALGVGVIKRIDRGQFVVTTKGNENGETKREGEYGQSDSAL